MEIFSDIWALFMQFIDVMLHIDTHLEWLVTEYGVYVYGVLFLVIFCETGLVILPFLPGDSLLFAGGTLVGAGILEYIPLTTTLFIAAVIGDAVNFRIGRFVGPSIYEKNYRFLKREYLQKAHEFYERHGGKAIILARFIPIIRTFAPFVAGVARMHQGRFLLFNITGAGIWVFGLVTAGYLLANIPFVKNRFSLIIYGIILLSIMPIVIEAIRLFLAKKRDQKNSGKYHG